MQAGDGVGPADQLIGRAGHGRDHDGDLVAGVDLALDPRGDRLDALEVGHRGAAELHHDAGLAGRSRHRSRSREWDACNGAAPVAGRAARIHTQFRTPLSKARDRQTASMIRPHTPADRASAMQPRPSASIRPRSPSSPPWREAWWDPAGKFRPLHRLNPARLAFIRDQAAARFGRDALRPAPLCGPAPARYRLRRRAAVRADGAAGRRGHRHRRGGAQHRRRPPPCRAERARRSTIARRRAEALAARPASASTSCWPWRWSSMWPTRPASWRACGGAGGARRPAHRRHPQPHRQVLRPRHRRGRICAALAAARHP